MTSLTGFGAELWLAEGPSVMGAAGFHFPTRMAVMRLQDGGLALWSPIHLTPRLRDGVTALGPVRHLIGPNGLHHLALADWQAAFPAARLHAAPGIAAKRPDLRIDSTLGPVPPPDWQGQLDQTLIDTRLAAELVFHHRPSRTALFTDLLQQMPPGWFRGWRACVARLDLMTGPAPAVPRKFRLAIRDRAALRAALKDIAGWQADRLVIAHGPCQDSGANALIAKAFAWAG